MKKILIVSRKAERCGIAQYGKRVINILKKSNVLDIYSLETNDPEEFNQYFENLKPDIVIWNYYPVILPWVTDNFLINKRESTKHICLYHELWLNFTPDAIISNDSTLMEDETKNLFSSPRPLFEDIEFEKFTPYDVPVIGTFGFGFSDKNYDVLCKIVCEQFDKALIRMHIPFAEFGDNDGAQALQTIDICKNIINDINPNIQLICTHNFLNDNQLLNFLHQNDLNLFLYKYHGDRGLSSTIDYALSAKKPIGISNSEQFRHINTIVPNVSDTSLQEIILKGKEILLPLYEEHSNTKLINKYEYIINKIST